MSERLTDTAKTENHLKQLDEGAPSNSFQVAFDNAVTGLTANETHVWLKLERSLRMMFGMMKSKTLLGVCAQEFAVTSQAVPSLTIDDFADPAGGQSATILNGIVGSTASSTALAPLALGGWRTIGVEVQARSREETLVLSRSTPSRRLNNFQFATTSKVDSKGWVTWNANGAGLNAKFLPAALPSSSVEWTMI